MKLVSIYGLSDKRDGIIRYIGKAADPKNRLACHLRDARSGVKTHKSEWIRCLLKVGQLPQLEVLDHVLETEWEFWEREYIRLFRAWCPELTNNTDGGDGVPIRRGEEHPMFGYKHSKAAKQKIRMAHLGKPRSLESRKKQSRTVRGAGNHFFGRSPTRAHRMKISRALYTTNLQKGHIGVSWNSRVGKWKAGVQRMGRKCFLGYFSNREDAIRVVRGHLQKLST